LTDAATISRRLLHAFRDVLGDRLVCFVVHGSAVQGGYLVGISDLDFYVFLHGRVPVEGLLDLQDRLGDFDTGPFDYLQLSDAIDVDDPSAVAPRLIPGSYTVMQGSLPSEDFVHSHESLVLHGRRWLESAPKLVRSDIEQWSTATGPRRTWLVRLILTRLKPTLRAMLAARGEPAEEVWAEPYEELARRWSAFNPDAARRLRDLVSALGGSTDERSIGRAAIELVIEALRDAGLEVV
jgi:hypothetical protein